MIVFPATSITRAPAGAVILGPTCAMRLPVTRMSPRSITSSPFMVTRRAPRRSTEPSGAGRGTVSETTPCVVPHRADSAYRITESIGAR